MALIHSCKNLIHDIQVTESIHLSDKSKDYIRNALCMVEQETIAKEGYWKEEYQDLKKKGFPLKWNELRIKLARMKTPEADEILELMCMLDDGVSIR